MKNDELISQDIIESIDDWAMKIGSVVSDDKLEGLLYEECKLSETKRSQDMSNCEDRNTPIKTFANNYLSDILLK